MLRPAHLAALLATPLALLAPTAHAGVPEQNKAIYLGNFGVVDTEIRFADFFGSDHTVMTWWMPQYPHAYTGPVLAENGGGTFLVGQGDFIEGDAAIVEEGGKPVFVVQIGNKKAVYLTPKVRAGKWVHVAVVRKGTKVSLFLDGVKQKPVEIRKTERKVVSAPEIDLGGMVGGPTGTLRLGRRTPGTGSSNVNWQAYGLVDDVAVFDRALDSTAIAAIISAKRLTGKEDGLLAGLSFETPDAGEQLPKKLRGAWPNNHRAYHMPVSPKRASAKDDDVFGNPFVIGAIAKPLRLPFKKGEVWRVIQGYDERDGSHRSAAAFCYDFVLDGPSTQSTKYPNGTEFAPVYAAAKGKITRYHQDGGFEGPREPYTIKINVAEGEWISYLHMAANSLTKKATGGTDPDGDHVFEVAPAAQKTIGKGDYVGKLGPDAAHLHFGGTNLEYTFPVAFDDYWVSDDAGKTWRHVVRGIPTDGQLIKRD